MMGPMGTRLGVLAGELWLVAGEETGDDSLLSEDPVGGKKQHTQAQGLCHCHAAHCTSRPAITKLTLGVRSKSGQVGKDPQPLCMNLGSSNSRSSVWSSAPEASEKQS